MACTRARALTILVAVATAIAVGRLASAQPAPEAQREAGAHPGVWYWTLPDAPAGVAGGMVPKQSWSGAGSGPEGEIYVGGMDHVANAALYRLRPGADAAQVPGPTLVYVGDARSAAAAAGNLQPGEPIEKFHTQPTFLNGRVLLANMNYSNVDAGYLQVRGFHWFGYDRADQRFRDLTATRAGGVALAHGGVPAMVADKTRGLVYAAVSPTGEIVRYIPSSGHSELLGRPAYGRAFVYPGRALWVGTSGRVYFTAGNPSPDARSGGPYNAALFDHVRYWDPRTREFGEEQGWKLHDTRAIDHAHCPEAVQPRTCFLMDNVGHVYRYAENGARPSWSYLGSIGQERDELHGLVWVFQVQPSGRKAWIVARRGAFFEFDLMSGEAALKGNLYTLEPSLRRQDFYGATAWDWSGRFYFSAFPKYPADPGRTRLVAINPWLFVPSVSPGSGSRPTWRG